ncbi:uncharacterized protein LOC113212683 [Frankliniella occidentalis]|uniref:Uncharacterized protein LOC113212683 n=1 Tax=Frankliniella occidentalis TaxID=133901 RepID=A0A6J1T2T4_FRAOC|nr:uncharacterized protein LOC113212683 [Frankliniella occidentalis]XP_052119532.1 uncharacterized protein LOC113212683 [Frankliniella occidentalis]XP_052119533.1 uncharacterized protein LOC113212683 [Frankliniella occidentalis]
MSARTLAAALVLAAAAVVASSAQSQTHDSTMATAEDVDKCCAFVHASVGYQRELAEKIKQLNGRRVYLFDASGFSAEFADELTPDNIRYKTGVLAGGLRVDAVLSVSAHRALGDGPDAARTFLRWTGREQDTLLDEHGVYV